MSAALTLFDPPPQGGPLPTKRPRPVRPALEAPLFRVLAVGGGVQSSTIIEMCAEGALECPEYGIFADTQWEPSYVYEHLAYLKTRAPFPIYTVTAGNLRQDIVDGANRGTRIANVPFFVMGKDGRPAMLRRTCTKEYKIEPKRKMIAQLLHEWLGKKDYPPGAVEQWIGISTNEAVRMKDSDVRYIYHRWPLVERGMSRKDCEAWLRAHGLPVPWKSACKGCPYHDAAAWRETKRRPDDWADVTEFDGLIRTGLRGANGTPGLPRGGEAYLHRSLKPLAEVDFSTAEERGQGSLFEGFNAECEGMCGV